MIDIVDLFYVVFAISGLFFMVGTFIKEDIRSKKKFRSLRYELMEE